MLGHYSGLSVDMLGYPITLAIMIALYASEISSSKVRAATRWLVPARSTVRRR
jgi:hypothetical protein